jgi:high affinity sulfate transporter 1
VTPAPSPALSAALVRWAPGLALLLRYERAWLKHDLIAGLVLTAVLVPVGMGYAEASGVPAIHGLYATIVPLVVYAIFGPSRIMVLGPDSTLAAVIAALILPLAAGSVERAVTLAAALSLLTGLFQALIGFARLGAMADLFSKPIRVGFLNAIALTVIVGQLPKLLGLPVQTDELPERIALIVRGVAAGEVNLAAFSIGATSLALILVLRRVKPRWPGVLVAVALATLASGFFALGERAQLAVLGPMPQGLPAIDLPLVTAADLRQLAFGAAIIALLSFTDTSVLSRALAARGGSRVSQDQEMIALGAANLGNGFFQGFPISSSASRTPVAEAAGARTQLAGLVGAATIALLLIVAPALLGHLPHAVLAGVVIAASVSFADVAGMFALWRQRRTEFALALASFLGVALVGVIQGIVITIAIALLLLVWNAWHPYYATLGRVDGRKGWHDLLRHPQARQVPGLVIFRWDAQLFFANAEIFREQLLAAIDRAPTTVRVVIVAADAINDVDVTAADVLGELHVALEARGIEPVFAGLKGPVKDRLRHYAEADANLRAMVAAEHLAPTVGSAVTAYRAAHAVGWKDWDEV